MLVPRRFQSRDIRHRYHFLQRPISLPYRYSAVLRVNLNITRILTSLPKYAASAIPQNSPTSTTPVKALIRLKSYGSTQAYAAAGLTSAGCRIISEGKGASMMKFALSLTTGPAFILPIRSDRPGDPSCKCSGDPISARLMSTLV